MKDKLLKLLKAKEEARAALVIKSEKSEDVAELRSIQVQIEALNGEITELRGMIAEAEAAEKPNEPEEARTAAVNGAQEPEKRQFTPGTGFKPLDGAKLEGEKRTKEEIDLADREKRGTDLKEMRSVTVGSSNVLLVAHQATDIGQGFNKVSSLIDRVTYMYLPGGESFTQPYLKDNPEGDYKAEGEAYATADATFGNAAINKSKVTAYSESTEELLKLPAAPYEQEVMAGITKSVRRKITKEILVGTGATNHLSGIFSTTADAIDSATDLGVAAITNTTLDDIIFNYGGDENVEDAAVLILNKADLKAFSQLRTTDGKKFHTIVTNGNTGTIDGIPFIINSAGCKAISATATTVGAYCMAYGPLSNYKLVVFSDLDVQRSTDFKFSTGQIAHRGSVFIGGNVVAQNGFLRITKKAAV
ncbi:Phage capsid family protein [Sporomusa ovata DSM 2662]|uniref:Phage major capsid protein n=1 Tax=Sporomusa ovata TaxID=2378 RepID=A0A0U1L1V2_9FIRM|nr:phage major capsid protein [Sporomusa ovata]EQB27465.1 phage major capsid protein, HK97 family [Sporomusa ovata DSM 2662]CQR73309.1 Phage major capsid protein [Sporomusa ovata]